MTHRASGLHRQLALVALQFSVSAGLILHGTRAAALPGDTGEGPDAVRIVMDSYATCLVRAARKTVGPIIAGDPNNGAFERWRKNLRGQCITDTNSDFYVNPSTTALRMAIADVLVREHKLRPGPAQIAKAPPLIHPNPAAAAKNRKKGATFDRRLSQLSPLGECVVRADPAGAAALLASDLESRDELAKANALSAVVGPCARAHGRSQLSVLELRGAVALNYYRLLQAARKAAGAGARDMTQ